MFCMGYLHYLLFNEKLGAVWYQHVESFGCITVLISFAVMLLGGL